MTTYLTESSEETMKLGSLFAEKIKRRCSILFFGDLGAGKTTFIKGMAQGLGISPDFVASPSFQYLEIHSGRMKLYHFDLWRLATEEQFFEQGFDEFLEDPNGICCFEWAEKLPSPAFVIEPHIKIKLFHERENRRKIVIEDEKR